MPAQIWFVISLLCFLVRKSDFDAVAITGNHIFKSLSEQHLDGLIIIAFYVAYTRISSFSHIFIIRLINDLIWFHLLLYQHINHLQSQFSPVTIFIGTRRMPYTYPLCFTIYDESCLCSLRFKKTSRKERIQCAHTPTYHLEGYPQIT